MPDLHLFLIINGLGLKIIKYMKQYGDLPKEFTAFESSKIVILPVPYDGTNTWLKGADKGAKAILEASANLEMYDIEQFSDLTLVQFDAHVHMRDEHNRSKVDHK